MTLRGRARECRMKRSNGRTMVIAVPDVLVLLAGANAQQPRPGGTLRVQGNSTWCGMEELG
jgi:hypothetical protein